MLRKLAVGDSVYIVSTQRWSNIAKTVIVEKVGRAWFYVGRDRYSVADGHEDAGRYTSTARAYNSKEEYEQGIRRHQVARDFCEAARRASDDQLLDVVGGVVAAEELTRKLNAAFKPARGGPHE